MKSTHTWFSSGKYSLLAHLDSVGQAAFDLGVLIVPPFGWEDICSYRPLRELGRMLAALQIPTLRFDLPGTGDSSGGPNDPALLAAWIQSIGDAAAELKRLTGVREVAVVGIRLGAMLAVASSAECANIQDLVLWGPYATGRAMLRELRAFRNMEVAEYADAKDAPAALPANAPELEGGLETAGFRISPETLAAIEGLDLTSIKAIAARRALLLSRDDFPLDARLRQSLAVTGCRVDGETGNGLGGMLALPHEAIAPGETFHRVYEWLTRDRQRQSLNLAPPTELASNHVEISAGVRESIYLTPGLSGNSFAILSEPILSETLLVGAMPKSEHADWCLLFLNPGAARHVGPNRMWVEAARRWAARGVPSVRLDLAGIGESDGEQKLDVAGLYHEALAEQVERIVDSLGARLGATRFVAVGLCSGAFWAFHAALRNSALRAGILLNPRLFFWDPEVDRRRDLRRTSNAVRSGDTWRRLLHGHLDAKRIKSAASDVFSGALSRRDANANAQIPAVEFARALANIEQKGTRLTMVFTEGEPLLREIEEEGHLPPPDAVLPFRCVRISNGGHTFRPLWAQSLVHHLIDKEMVDLFAEKAPPAVHTMTAAATQSRFSRY